MGGEGVKAVEGRGKEEERVEGEVVGTAIWEPAGQSRGIDGKIKEAEGRKPPPPPEYSLLSTLKRACQLRGRATKEELPPSPAGRKENSLKGSKVKRKETERLLRRSTVCFLQLQVSLRRRVMLEERVKPRPSARPSNRPPQETEEPERLRGPRSAFGGQLKAAD